MSQPFLSAKKLSKTIVEGEQARPLFDAINLDLAQGECLALLGRSGSGKSTLLHLLAGLEPADSGEIHIAGKNLSQLSETQRTLFRRQHIGVVYQFFNLIPTLSVAENIRLPLELLNVGRDTQDNKVHELLKLVGLANRAKAFPDRLSGGEQQRVALCRALIHRPPLILADEPTGNLDANSGEVVLKLLLELSQEFQQSVLIVTHSRAVAQCAQRVLSLSDGQLQAGGDDNTW